MDSAIQTVPPAFAAHGTVLPGEEVLVRLSADWARRQRSEDDVPWPRDNRPAARPLPRWTIQDEGSRWKRL